MNRITSQSQHAGFSYRNSRQGISSTFILFALVALATIAASAGGLWWITQNADTETEDEITHTVKRDIFSFDIVARGELESSGNTEVRCEVKARNGSGTSILRVVPEGSNVQAGDFLVELDSSALENEKILQQVTVNTSEAIMVQSENVYETAKIARKEYEEGTLIQEKQTIQSEIFVAQENLRRAQEFLEYSKRLARKGYITDLQLAADQFAVDKAQNELDTAQTKLHVLLNFTKTKMLKQFESDIVTSKAKWEADKNSYQLEKNKLEEINDQIAKCTISAPTAGQVKYANKLSRRGGTDFIIEPGTIVRERQEIITLPDPTQMQIKIDVNEAVVNKIKASMLASVRLVGQKSAVFAGTVTKVNEYSEPSNWRKADVKEFATYVRIENPGGQLRSGMTAEVTIHVEQIDNALQVPVQAFYEHGVGEYYCFVNQQGTWQAKKVARGPSNDRFVIIEQGLAEGDEVSLNPKRHIEQANLPELSPQDLQKVVSRPSHAERLARNSMAQNGNRRSPAFADPSSQDEQSETGQEPSREKPRRDPRNPDPAEFAGRMLARIDKNQDGYISEEEWPAALPASFTDTDANNDGKIDRQEITSTFGKLRGRRPAGVGG